MKKQIKSNRKIKRTFVIVAFFAFMFVTQAGVFAQDDAMRFGALYNCPQSSLYNFKVLDCENEKYCNVEMVNVNTPSASFKTEILKSKILDALGAGGCTIDGKPLESAKTPAPPKANKPGIKTESTGKNEGAKAARFKPGDRVKACPMQMENCEEYWENCTVVKDYMASEGADSYQVRCDDPQGGKGTLSNVPPKFIRAGGAPETAPPACPFNEPSGTVSKNAAPSPQLFQRVIYERYRDMNPGKRVGVTFGGFALAGTQRNGVVDGHLIQPGAPQGAVLYRYKIESFLLCVENSDETVTQTESREQYFMCFKDKAGDWACAEDGRRSWDHRTIRAR
jgi:hypothetical protein